VMGEVDSGEYTFERWLVLMGDVSNSGARG
jgi:hypothetical protein